jgi:hypothetical protein
MFRPDQRNELGVRSGLFKRCRTGATFVYALLVLVLTTHRADASVIATSYNTECGTPSLCEYEGNYTVRPLEQQFTLTAPDTILSIDASLGYSHGTSFPTSYLSMSIVNDSANTPGNTVYATDTSDSGTLTDYLTSYADINFGFNSVNLGPGTYWMVLTVTDPTIGPFRYFVWEYQTPGTVPAAGPGGVIDPLNGFGNTYSPDAFLTTINGTVTPEPGTVLTFLGALAAMWAIRRRRAGPPIF